VRSFHARIPAVSEGRDPVEATADGYSASARLYRRLWAPVLLPFSLRLLRMLPLGRARRVLDVGAGVGALLPLIRDRAPRAVVVGADRAEGMIRLAPAGFPRVVADAGRLVFAKDAFDVATLAFMLFHVPSPARALQEVRRALRPGGSAGAATWSDSYRFPAIDVWTEELDRLGVPEDPTAWVDSSRFTNSPERMERLLGRAGFGSVRVRTTPYLRRWDSSEFVTFHDRFGSVERLDLLPAGERGALLRVLRRRMRDLPAKDFVQRREVILSVGRAT